MTSAPEPRVFALSIHAGYACRRSGACCTAGWDIGVEPRVFDRIARLADAGGLSAPGAPSGAPRSRDDVFAHDAGAVAGDGEAADAFAAVLRRDASNACVCFDRQDGNRCVIHRQLGHEWLPAACRHFPRVTLIEARGVSVTLSHYCPTAARMLFRTDVGRPAIVCGAPGLSDRAGYDGFDASRTIPPFVRPGLVFDDNSRAAWETFLVDTCSTDTITPEDAVAAMAEAAERLRCWRPSQGGFDECARERLDAARRDASERTSAPHAPVSLARVADLFDVVARSVPAGLPRPQPPDDLRANHARLVAPAWPGLARPILRYLAARGFAAWSAYQGDGVRTQVAVLAAALAVLHVEAARLAAAAGRMLDEDLLLEAIRAADLLTVHQSNPEAVARELGCLEPRSRDVFLASVSLRA